MAKVHCSPEGGFLPTSASPAALMTVIVDEQLCSHFTPIYTYDDSHLAISRRTVSPCASSYKRYLFYCCNHERPTYYIVSGWNVRPRYKSQMYYPSAGTVSLPQWIGHPALMGIRLGRRE